MKSDIQLINENQLELVSGGMLEEFTCLLGCCLGCCCGFWYTLCQVWLQNNNPLNPQNNQGVPGLPNQNQQNEIPYSNIKPD
ncbi:MAG: hypothetical protein IJC57_02420 [Clostridia bacterium]|nr:hypothetical protein [Clostridia bacterium]